jgi:TetR/AcrR family transcriptional regulator
VARSRASDYFAKRQAILDRSAELFTTRGYDRASMRMIADAIGISKANLYHYYHDKETLLFDVLRFHLEELRTAARAANALKQSPEAKLRTLATALLDAYRGADAAHKLQISNMYLLPPERQEELKGIQREVVDIFENAIAEVAPALRGDRQLLRPITMSLFGMLNWHFLWFNPRGPISREDYATLATKLIIDGCRDLAQFRKHDDLALHED